ncbi:TRAP transporter small permease [Orrella sp. JC864]|uniref:TRAP transporter small permease subunit n=1 Tax=Orrella sp. JC864 TaxID=3120298 RepID=UPI0012BCA0F2
MTNNTRLPLLGRALALAGTLSNVAVWVGGALTLASVALICFEVIARKFLGFTLSGADELSGYAFAISTSWALAFAAINRANVRVDAIYQRLPVRAAAVLDWIALVATAVFMVYLTRYAADVAMQSWQQQSSANTPLATPLWIPQGLWVLGLAWMCIVLALMLVRACCALVTGDLAALQRLCGVRSAQEEAEEEAAAGARIIEGERA